MLSLISKCYSCTAPAQRTSPSSRSYELEAEDREIGHSAEKALSAQDVLQFIMSGKYILAPADQILSKVELCAGIFLPQQLHVFVSKRRMTEAAAGHRRPTKFRVPPADEVVLILGVPPTTCLHASHYFDRSIRLELPLYSFLNRKSAHFFL